MDISAAMPGVTRAIAGSSDVNTWCNTNYSQDVTVRAYCDGEDGPAPEDCPAVIIYPAAKGAGTGRQQKETTLAVEVWIHDNAINADDTYDNLEHYQGGHNLEALRKLVLAAIAAWDASGAEIVAVDTEWAPPIFPDFGAFMTITWRDFNTIAGNYID